MDPIAHTLVGACLADTGLRKTTARASAALIIGANLPDIDAVAAVMGRDTALHFRRGWTHGVLAMAILPALLAGALWLWERRSVSKGAEPTGPPMRLGWLLGLSYFATWTHPALDWLNTYGVRLLMPFSGEWFYGNTLFIIDPYLWLLVGTAVVLLHSRTRWSARAWTFLGSLLTLLVTLSPEPPVFAKIAWCLGLVVVWWMRRRDFPEALLARVARGGVVALAVYIGAGVAVTSYVEASVRSDIEARGETVVDIMAGPLPGRPFARDVVVVTERAYLYSRWSALGEAELLGGEPRVAPSPVVERALAAPGIAGMRNWLRFPAYEVHDRPDGGHFVVVKDVRYSRRKRVGIGISTVALDAAGTVLWAKPGRHNEE